MAKVFNTEPFNRKIDELLSKAIVAYHDTNIVLESRNLLHLATVFQTNDIAPTTLLDRKCDLTQILTSGKTARQYILDHIDEYGWLRTFAYLGEPFSEMEIRERIATALQSGVPQDKLAKHAARSSRERQTSISAIGGVSDGETQDLLRLACNYFYWRFERIDTHFRAEVRIRPILNKIAAALGLTRNQLVHCTADEIFSALESLSALPEEGTIAARMTNGFNCYVEAGHLTM